MEIGWTEPTSDEIETASDLIITGGWDGALPPGIIDIEWVTDGWVASEADHKVLIDYWRRSAGPENVGGFTAGMVDPAQLKGILRHVLLLDVMENGMDARYRVYGSGIAGSVGVDWTGKTVSEMNRSVQSNQALFYRSCYRAVFKKKCALYTHHKALSWADAKSWKRLIIPVFEESNQNLIRYLVCNIPCSPGSLTTEELSRMRSRYKGLPQKT